MAINWDIWNQGLQNQLNEIGSGQYDWSFVTPEVVKGFTRYQALRPETEIKEAEEYKKAMEGLEDEVKRRRKAQMDADRTAAMTDEEIGRMFSTLDKPLPDVGAPDFVADAQDIVDFAKMRGGKNFKFPQNKPVGGNANLESQFNPLLQTRTQEEVELPQADPDMTDEERVELETEIMRERLGNKYNTMKRSYDIYGSLNPYEQMIQAGKRSSYWDPEIGKIYTDAGEKIRNDRIAAWKEALEGETMLQNRAMDMYKQTGLSRYRREAEKRLDRITNLLNNNPRKDGQWFEGYDTDAVTDPNVASAYGKLEKMILDEGPMEKETLLTLMAENGIKGEDATDLLKQNDAEWAKRYGPAAEATKRTEEAIRAQSETFKKDQTERIKNMNLLDDLREKLASKNASEADYRMAAETLRKLNLDVSKSFDEERKKLIETAKTNMVNNPSFKTIGAFLVLTVGDKLGLLPEDLNSITSNEDWKKLVRDGIETLYETDANMYEVERENMEGYLKGVPGIDTSRLSWMQSKKALTPADVGIGAVADTKGNFTITLPNGETDVWTSETVKEFPEFLKFFNGKRSRVKVKKGTTNILTDGRWELNIDTNTMTEV